MSWQIRIPHTHREQSPGEALADNADSAIVDREERRVAFWLLFNARESTVGELIDKIDHATPEQRRRLLDEAREGCGLETASSIEAKERLRATRTGSGDLLRRDGDGFAVQACCVPWCTFAERSNVRRWACDAHKDAGDFEPWRGGLRIAMSESGALVDLDERDTERARQAVRDESAHAQAKGREAERAAENTEAEALRRVQDERVERELPQGFGT